MGSTRPTDRSLGETTFLPQWMKGKVDTRFDYSESTFSPPADDFFCIRYPKQQQQQQQDAAAAANKVEGFRPLNEILGSGADSGKQEPGKQQHLLASLQSTGANNSAAAAAAAAHHKAGEQQQPKVIVANKSRAEEAGSGDEFTSPRSLVHAAQQLMSSKFGGVGVARPSEEQHYEQHQRHQSEESAYLHQMQQQQQQQRRGSKSLPATPSVSPGVSPDSSPRSRRRLHCGNRFFTGAYVPDPERRPSGWLLASILGQSRDLATATRPPIAEEDEEPPMPPFFHQHQQQEQEHQEELPARALTRKKSISSQDLTYLGAGSAGEELRQMYNRGQLMLQAKPSELREMNFWSPTSM